MSETVEVRIRHEDEVKAKRLTDWPISDLDGLIAELSRWGVYDGGDIRTAMSGEFSIADGSPHFVIYVHDSDG